MEAKDKRNKREIANSNERRRMQSINTGFLKLKRLLPVNDGEKLSKAAILQQAAEFVQEIQREKSLLHEHNMILRGIVTDIKNGADISTALKNTDVDFIPELDSSKSAASATIATSTSTKPTKTTTISDATSPPKATTPIPIPISTQIVQATTLPTSSPSPNTTDTTTTSPIKSSNPSTNPINLTELKSSSTTINNQERVNKTTTSTKTRRNYKKAGTNKQPIPIHDRGTCQELTNQQAPSGAEISTSDKDTSPKNAMSVSGVAKAAIALPLEVPFISETAIRVERQHHPEMNPLPSRKLIKLEATTTTSTPADISSIDSQETASKSQTLDTICKAIMEIEGDRVFRSEIIKDGTS